MKGKLTTVLLVLVFAIGLSLLLYPTVSNVWNSFHSSRVVSNYDRMVSALPEEDYTQIMEAAREYNRRLLHNPSRFLMGEEEDVGYQNLLALGENQVMGYIDIPKLGVRLPIYHGTGEAVLQAGVGHIVGSSLPVGGESTHTALSGHSGLPSARLLTDLDQLQMGDLFYLHVFGNVLAYQVDQILVVEPDDMAPLEILEGQDFATLVTCTPYGINTHRLLVRGVRAHPAEVVDTTIIAEASNLGIWTSAALFGAPVFALCLIVFLIFRKRK